MICDDFATGAPIPDFAKYISIIREKELSVTILCQSESQLESMYSPAESVTIINNCDTYIFTGGMDLKTAQSVSLRMNLPVDEVLALPVGQFVVFRRGQMPIQCQRYPILEDPVYLQLPTAPPEYVIVDEPYPEFSF
jgi:type IV secretory pathway TraG/TraD family ATPase VirD4